jgi:hypothetical protein
MAMSTAVYVRVSTGQQSIDQQHDAIGAAGIATPATARSSSNSPMRRNSPAKAAGVDSRYNGRGKSK